MELSYPLTVPFFVHDLRMTVLSVLRHLPSIIPTRRAVTHGMLN